MSPLFEQLNRKHECLSLFETPLNGCRVTRFGYCAGLEIVQKNFQRAEEHDLSGNYCQHFRHSVTIATIKMVELTEVSLISSSNGKCSVNYMESGCNGINDRRLYGDVF